MGVVIFAFICRFDVIATVALSGIVVEKTFSTDQLRRIVLSYEQL